MRVMDEPTTVATGEDLSKTWGITRTRAAWQVDGAGSFYVHNNVHTGTSMPAVAVLDTGVYGHTELNIIARKDCITDGGTANDGHGHGALAQLACLLCPFFGRIGYAHRPPSSVVRRCRRQSMPTKGFSSEPTAVHNTPAHYSARKSRCGLALLQLFPLRLRLLLRLQRLTRVVSAFGACTCTRTRRHPLRGHGCRQEPGQRHRRHRARLPHRRRQGAERLRQRELHQRAVRHGEDDGRVLAAL